MKKYFLSLILLLFILNSCDFGNNVPINTPIYTVHEIKYYDSKTCLYCISTPHGEDNIKYIDVFKVIDSIGKFNIRDTVFLVMFKK